MTEPKGKLLTVKTVSERLGISISSVYRLIDGGQLKHAQVGPKKGIRVYEYSVNAWLGRSEEAA